MVVGVGVGVGVLSSGGGGGGGGGGSGALSRGDPLQGVPNRPRKARNRAKERENG